MVKIATSIAAVTILAGTALAQGYYDEQFERSLTDVENLEARSEAVLSDYLAAREEVFDRDYDDAELEARDFDDLEEYEARDLEELEEREPIGFGALKGIGKGLMHRVFKKKSNGGSHRHLSHFRHGAGAAMDMQQDPNNRRRSDDEDLFEREEFDPELEARNFDDFEELEEREPIGFGALKGVGKGLMHRVFKKKSNGGSHRHLSHFRHGAGAAMDMQQQQQDPNNRRRSDAEDLFEREEFGSELVAREFEEYLEERGLRSWLRAKLSGGNKSQPPPPPADTSSDALATRAYEEYLEARHIPHFLHWFGKKHGAPSAPSGGDDQQQQQYPREFDDVEELEMRDIEEELIARAPGVVSWLKSKFHRKHHDNAAPAPSSYDDSQQYRREFEDAEDLEMREFDDVEDLEMREFDEELEDVLARDYDNFDELD